jgi:SAM-dependent methyltransferase
MEHRVARKLFMGMWPNIFIAREWSDADIGKEYDPSNYTESGSHVDTLCDLVAQYATSKDRPILDIGCNCGRHINQLASMGFTNLHGVDVSKRALEFMPEWFPATVGKVTTHHDLFQRYLSNAPDSSFDIVYTHTITIEEVHPSFNLVRHLARVTRNHVILLIDEHGGFSRFWEFEFRRQDFFLTFLMRPISSTTEPPHDKMKSQPTMFVFTKKGAVVNYPGVRREELSAVSTGG